MIDWGIGHYESTANEVAPVARHVLALADVQPGERVLDLATGTGNAALLAASLGATVTGLDAAPRLIEVARTRAAQSGADISFVVGDAQSLPFEDGSFEVVLSVFGIIFAADAARAFAEMIRVLTPGGRAVLSVWAPAGTLNAMVTVFARALAQATGANAHRFPWHDRDAVAEIAARHGARIEVHDAELEIFADSPEAYLQRNQEHPMGVAARPVLERAGIAEDATDKALAILREGNEDPAHFKIRSPYRLVEVRRDPERPLDGTAE